MYGMSLVLFRLKCLYRLLTVNSVCDARSIDLPVASLASLPARYRTDLCPFNKGENFNELNQLNVNALPLRACGLSGGI